MRKSSFHLCFVSLLRLRFSDLQHVINSLQGWLYVTQAQDGPWGSLGTRLVSLGALLGSLGAVLGSLGDFLGPLGVAKLPRAEPELMSLRNL